MAISLWDFQIADLASLSVDFILSINFETPSSLDSCWWGSKPICGSYPVLKRNSGYCIKGVHMVVMLELHNQEEVISVALLFIHESLKVLIELLVHSFYLFIWLWVPGCRWDDLNSEKVVKFLSKEHNKLQISIWNNIIRKIMEFLHMV